jgi:iron complex outermembrane receptor protein
MSGSSRDFVGERPNLLRLGYGLAVSALAVALSAAASTAFAQEKAVSVTDAGDTGGSDASVLQEVLVTARRREENVMHVPDTVSVYTSEQIDNLRLNEISEFVALTPNVKIAEEQDAATNEIYIRGIGSNRNEASAVAFVVDGVVLPDPDAFTTDLSDAEQVEILKGPQGALYGKGALAGAIVINTRQPTNQFEADTKVSYGSGSTYDVFGGVGGPIVPDTVLARLAVKYQHSDGNYTNAFNGQPFFPDNFVKPSLTLIVKPTDRLTLDFRGSYYKQDAGNPPYTLANLIGPPGTGTNGTINSEVAATPIDHDALDLSRRKIYDGSLTASYDTSAGTLTSTTAYDKIDFYMTQDLDFTPLPTALADQTRDTRGSSQELRFTSPGDRSLRYIVGAYYQYTRRYLDTHAQIDACLLGLAGNCAQLPQIPAGILIPLHLAENTNYDHQYAGFAQANYDLSEKIELTAALRYDQDNRSQSDALLDRVDAANFHAWQPKASLSYKFSPDQMAYVTYAQGYKSGIFNTFNTVGGNIPLIVKPESTDGFEVGTKHSLFGRRLLLSTAAYYTKYKNAQEYHLDIQSGGQATVNVDRSRIYGFEVEAAARPVKGLDLNAAFGYTNSKIQDFNGTAAYVGQPLPSTPRYTLNVGPQYTYALPDATSVSARVDFAQYGKTVYQDFQNPDTNQVLTQVPYHTVNAQIAFTHQNWTLTVFGKNVFDERYVNSAYSRYISALIFSVTGDLIQPAVGATYGVELRARF